MLPPDRSLSGDQFLSARNEALSTRSSLWEGSSRGAVAPDYESAEEDVFDIPPKHRSSVHLRKWKAATLALNAARRFRYTAKYNEEQRAEEIKAKRNERLKRIRTYINAVRAAKRFQEAGAALDKKSSTGFGVEPEKLVSLVQEHRVEYLAELGGVNGITYKLQTNLSKGIKDEPQEVELRKSFFGPNSYTRQPPRGFFAFLLDAFKDLTLIILILCAALSLGLGIKSHGVEEGWYDGVSITVAVLLVILVTAISDYKQSLQFMALSEEKRNVQVQVIRGGRRKQVSIFDVVVGDIVLLNIGDQVPADGLFVEGHSLFLDESSMTGESEPVHVHRLRPFLLSGSKVSDGHGLMLVTGVGMMTEWGQLMAALGEETGEETPLQVRLNGVATLIGKVGLTVAGLLLVILIIFYFSGHTSGSSNSGKFKRGETSGSVIGNTVVDILVIAVTIIVVAVPEGLPLAVTLSLAYAMKKMIADKALVRRLSACETMGCATTICSDKTGTLTLNQMSVVKAWIAGKLRDPVTDTQYLHKDAYGILIEGIVQNSNGSVFVPSDGEPEVTGSPTEKAVLCWGLKIGMNYEEVKSQSTILQVETFNSIKKHAGVAVKVSGGKVHVHWKGAAEIVLQECDKLLSEEGLAVPISATERENVMQVIEGMAAESLRCIAFGFQEINLTEVPTGAALEDWKIPEGPLTLIAVVGIKDPCRPEVPECVRRCQAAGIVVRMITGDNILTAKAIATECGILKEGYAIEGVNFRSLTPEDRLREVPKIEVMARSSPTDKLLMVQTLRELGEVVAVTGDGTNDAPALREADIGLAMGIQGTEVAKENSDIIILDDNFASVVRVVRWGRSVYLNIQKFIQFQLTVNVAALAVNFIAAVSSGSVPLTAVQLLWVNLIMDTLGALALATERPTDELLLRPPVGRKEPLISNVMWRNIFSQAAFQVTVLLVLQFRGEDLLNLDGPDADRTKRTIIFNAFVFCQLFNEVNARKLEERNVFRGLLGNWLFLGILGGSLILQVIIVEFLNKFASTVKLEWRFWLLSIAIGFISWPLAFVTKYIPVPKKPFIIKSVALRRKGRRESSRASGNHSMQMQEGEVNESTK